MAVSTGKRAIGIDGRVRASPSPARRTHDFASVKDAVPDTPVLANTGVRLHNVADSLAVADGASVGTSLKRNRDTWSPFDAVRIHASTRAERALL
jgi:predicted TIM-barrel enzyme